MTVFYYFVISSITLAILLGALFSFITRKQLRNMQGMILAMTMGMNVGLTSGVLFGTLLQGNLYLSTILSISIGIFSGIACGMSMGLLPSIEGFMSGLMGGMMGAMLGEMITKDQSDTLLKMLLTLTICSLLLFKILPTSTDRDCKIEKKRWYLYPLLTFIFLSAFMIIGNNLDKSFSNTNNKMLTTETTNHSNHVGSNKNQATQVRLDVKEATFSYTPSKLIIKKNEPVTLFLINSDSVDHDIEIIELPFNFHTTSDHNLRNTHDTHDENVIHLHTPANNQEKITFTPLKEGIFTFYCTVPGHAEKGMIGKLVVEEK